MQLAFSNLNKTTTKASTFYHYRHRSYRCVGREFQSPAWVEMLRELQFRIPPWLNVPSASRFVISLGTDFASSLIQGNTGNRVWFREAFLFDSSLDS